MFPDLALFCYGLSSFMTNHRVCNYINTTGVTSGAGTANSSGAPEFIPSFWCGNQNPYIEEQTTQWPQEKVQRTNNDLQNIHIKLKIEQHEPHQKLTPLVSSNSCNKIGFIIFL
jgi:hypothetical protein